jgi:Ca-activated chloride channel homolog
MNFVNSRVLWAIPIVLPGVIWFLWWSWRKRNALVRLFVSERLLPQLLESYSPERRKIKMALQVGAVLFLMLALARPQWGFVWEEANQQGRDILVAIDTSRSMLAPDMAPNRLTRAKLAALDLMRLSKNDRLGLIAFAGAAFLQCPLTLDDEAFRQSIEALDTSIIPQGGTAVTEAIHTAVKTFATEEGDNHKVLIIFTDGEDHDGGALMAAEDADNHKLKIFTVGVGTPAGELVQILDERGNSTYVKDEKGNVVKSRLNEDLLRQIATAAKGFYIPLREGNAMQVLYQRGLEPLPTSDVSSKLVRQLNEQFHWPLGIAIVLLLTEALLPAAAKKRSTSVKRSETPKTAVAAMLLLMFVASTQGSPARAYRDYKNGNFKDARNEYQRLLEKKPDDPKLNYNAGAAAYRAGEYDAAAKAFSNATKAPELDLQERAYYNLGNANYRLGAGQPTPDKKMALWNQAVQNFESAMKLNPQDADAKFNHELVKKQLEELKKQQQQQQQEKNDNKDQNKDDKNQQQQKQDNKDQKEQNQEQKENKDSKSEEQKKEDQQQQQQNQQDQQQSDKEKKEQQDKPEAKNPNGQEQADKQNAEQQREAEQEARAAQLAQMTPKQAEQMLDAQKTEEKALIYRQYDERKKKRNGTIKDW